MEAMSSGLPVLASRVGGIPELFGDAEMGTLVNPKDESALAEAMLALARLSAEERQRLGDNARVRLLARFTADRMIGHYEALYAEAWRAVFPCRD
jgi:glycosyltransferase involved in cell wall biosynthesis